MKKPKTLKQFLIPVLRRASLRWPAKVEARKNAKVIVECGHYKNGNVRTKVMYKCQHPECGKLVDKDGGQIDHKIAVIKTEGFTNFDDYINSLFCDIENLWHICTQCHLAKGELEQSARRNFKKQNKKK